MFECRYHGWCRLEHDLDFSVCCPCTGNGTDACTLYKPMPDVMALLKLAEDIEKDVRTVEYYDLTLQTMAVAKYAARIREALGNGR